MCHEPKVRIAPSDKVTMPLRELTELQTYANRHVAFALTLACPLRCGHCIAEAGPGRRCDTMPLSDASFYAAVPLCMITA